MGGLLKSLPKVDVILDREEIKSLSGIPNIIIVEAIREEIDLLRKKILSGENVDVRCDVITDNVLNRISDKTSMNLKKVVNATGIVIHTNLGRSCLPSVAVDAVRQVAENYSNLEFNLNEGSRGSRYDHVEELLCKITGGEAAMVVNNNAAAVLLVLSTLSKGKEGIVSRGQLVEIGGSFRIPDVMEQSGARLIEVGTTNRTHLFDYEAAINEETGVILKVHQSNYKILGFTEEASLNDLVALGKKNNIPVVEDIGSGVFIDLSKYGLSYEPTVMESIKAGVDVITFSGDKMLGGPQAGIIIGKKKYIDMMKRNQLTRALRIDKMTLAALEAILRLYIDENNALSEIPVLNMLTMDLAKIKLAANKLSRKFKAKFKGRAEINIEEDYSQVGGGSMPLENIKTCVVSIKPINNKVDVIDKELRLREVPIIARINKDKLLFDVRTIFEKDYNLITDALNDVL